MRTNQKTQRELDKLEKKFDKNYQQRRKLEAEQVKLVKKLEDK